MSDRTERPIIKNNSFRSGQARPQSWLHGETFKSQLSYWRQQLNDGHGSVLELPTDRPRLPIQTFRGMAQTFMLPDSLAESLKTLSRDEDVSFFSTLLAAFYVLLHRYTGQDDISIGVPVASRDGGEAQWFGGGFANILALRADMSLNPSFREFLGQVREVVLGACAHADLPFEQLVRELGLEGAPSHNALFQVMFTFRNSLMGAQEGKGLTIDDRLNTLEDHSEAGKRDLSLVMEETEHGLKGSFGYNADLFEAATMSRMAGHFQTLLSGIVANPDQRISLLPLLTGAERRQLLVQWNDTRTNYPKDCCLHQLFEAQEKQRPNGIALLFEDEQVTYAELNRRANQLAHYLQSLGVGPEVRVGICMERSVEMVVGILGILKSGGAYVPLDPAYPQERLAFMLEDARVSVLLTQQGLEERFPNHGAQVVCLGPDSETVARESQENPASGVSAENLAYVITTSGSTGKPKGIALRHSGVVNNLTDLNQSFGVGVEDRILAISSLSFDMCVYEVLGTLAAGGAIVMPSVSRAKDPAHWAELIVRHRVTVWNSAPQLLEMLVGYVENRPELHPRYLRVAILGGDWVPVTLPDRLKALARGVRVIVLGGATEASIHSIVYPVEETDPTWRSIPYGRPMANQSAYILDSHLQIVPVGIPGELHLGGIGLARDYFNRPDLTAEKFIPHPFSQEPGDRLYKTGDLARYMPDGNIELLGRMDHQVKIGGHRIELGEIVTALKQHPAVREAVVLAREDKPGNKRLVAYIVPEPASVPTHSDLRNFLKKTLPEYMVPAASVLLEAMPLSPNGKVDRRALPAPGSSRPELGTPFVQPRTELERLLSSMWREILDIEQIGVHDNFFELGGGSIQGAVFINKLQERLGEIVHIVAIFDAPTVADFAAYLGAHYPDAVLRLCGTESLEGIGLKENIIAWSQTKKIDSSKVEQMRRMLRTRKPHENVDQ